MRHALLLAAAVLPIVVATTQDASAQRRGPGIHGGGWGARSMGMRPGWHGGGHWRGAGWRGAGWNRPYIGRGWGYPGSYRRGWNSGWGWGAAGLAAGTILGAAAVPYYYDPYPYPYPYGYRAYAAPVAGPIGGYCATPVRTCQLIEPSVIGGGCSCRVAGGRARGTVVGP
jgi:hypothetical protein